MALDDVVRNAIRESGIPVIVFDNMRERKRQVDSENEKAIEEGKIPTAYMRHTPTELEITAKYCGAITPSELAYLHRLPDRELDPIIEKHREAGYKKATEEFLPVIEPHYASIIRELEDKSLPSLLIETPAAENLSGEYQEISKSKKRLHKAKAIIEIPDVEAYAELSENEMVKDALIYANKRDIEEFAKGRVEHEQRIILAHFANEKGELEKTKIKEYLISNISGISDEDKPKAYIEAVKRYIK